MPLAQVDRARRVHLEYMYLPPEGVDLTDSESMETVDGTVWVSFDMDEVNYGAYQDWIALAEAGLTFTGWHGTGADYGPEVYVCFEGQMYSAPSTPDGYPLSWPLGAVNSYNYALADRRVAGRQERGAWLPRAPSEAAAYPPELSGNRLVEMARVAGDWTDAQEVEFLRSLLGMYSQPTGRDLAAHALGYCFAAGRRMAAQVIVEVFCVERGWTTHA